MNCKIAARAGNDYLPRVPKPPCGKAWRLLVVLAALVFCLNGLAISCFAADAQRQNEIGQGQGDLAVIVDCQQLATRQKDLLKELHAIKKEIALLRMGQEKPGSREIFAGIGYILGLLGVAAFFASRKKVL